MDRGIVSVLVKCGVIEPKRTGPAVAMDPETARQVQRQQLLENQRRRRALVREALEKGEPPPVFKRGRPRKYTLDEAAAVKSEKDKASLNAYHKRVREGVMKLAELYLEQARSSDEHFFVET